MSPQSHEQQPSFDVPPQQPEQEEVQAGDRGEEFVGEAGSTRAVEQGISGSAPPVTQDPASLATPSISQSTADPAAPPQPAALPQGWMPQIADDTDLIEKEWVDKAKEIVAQTAHDPYLQNKEINKVRTEYLKKRYNKELKQSDN